LQMLADQRGRAGSSNFKNLPDRQIVLISLVLS